MLFSSSVILALNLLRDSQIFLFRLLLLLIDHTIDAALSSPPYLPSFCLR